MIAYVAPIRCGMAQATSASPAVRESAAQTGWPKPTCATIPSPKKLRARASVKSRYWSITTKVPGASFLRNEPQAEIASTCVQPAIFSAAILAR